MAKTFTRGDRVRWSSRGGKAVGKVLRKLTEPMKIKGTRIEASEDDPRYLVRSDNGGRAAHKPSALRKVERSDAKASKDSGKKKKTGGKNKRKKE